MFPKDPVANLNAANVAMQNGDFKSAAKYLDRTGDLPEALYARGVMAALCEDFETAVEWFIKAQQAGVKAATAEITKLIQR